MRKLLAAAIFVLALASSCAAAGATARACGPTITALQHEVSAPTVSYSEQVQLIARAASADPGCAGPIAALGRSVAEAANPMLRARGFLGPVGWYWNNIYFRVLSGSTPNMVLFGVPLFFAPVVLVGSLMAVLSGTKGARKRPYVPESIRTQVN